MQAREEEGQGLCIACGWPVARAARTCSCHVCCRHAGSLVLSGSIDGTAQLWDVRSGRCLSVKTGHADEVLDVAFDAGGGSFVSASADGTARCVHMRERAGLLCPACTRAECMQPLAITCNPLLLLCRLYNTSAGTCLATLEGHTGEISKAVFNPQVRWLAAPVLSACQSCRLSSHQVL